MQVSASDSKYRSFERIPTGIPQIDELIGGGIPRKYTTEILGEAGTGKSTLALFTIREAQKLGLRCVYADVERTFAFNFAEKLGIDLKRLGIIYADTAEEYFEEILELVRKKKADLIVIDSIGALESVEDDELKTKGYPSIALLISRFLPKMTSMLPEGDVALIVINHEKTDFMGNKRTLGGKSLKYHKSLSLKLSHNGKWVKKGEENVGKEVMVKIEKIKPHLGGIPWSETKVHYVRDIGFAYILSLFEKAEKILERRGNTYFFREEKLGSKVKAQEWVAANEELVKKELESFANVVQ